MSNTWFTSDLHIGHQNILSYCPWNRPFDAIEEMNESLVEMWNKDVKEGDLVYFLGDFAMKFTFVEEFLPRLNGDKVLVSGNHDKWHPIHKGHLQTRQKVLKLDERIVGLYDGLPKAIGGMKFLLNHFPWKEEEAAEHNAYVSRFTEWKPSRAKHPKTVLLFGHRHSRMESRIINHSIEVTYDAWGRMVPLEEILEIAKEII